MSEKKVYAMATDGCLDYVTAGKVYLTRPCYQCGDDSEDMEYFDPGFYEPWAFSAWKCSTHLNGGDWVRLELTEEEAEAINNGSKALVEASDAEGEKWIVADPQGDDEVSEVSEMLEYIARHVTEWPKDATSVRVDKDGEIRFAGNGGESDFYPSPRFEGEWVAEGNVHAMGKIYSRDEWEQARSDLLLHIHPQSELDADPYVSDSLTEFDTVNAPGHYTSGDIECIDAIQAQMTPEQFAGYLRGNCVKYIWRYQHKGGKESLLKAQWYLNRLIDVAED